MFNFFFSSLAYRMRVFGLVLSMTLLCGCYDSTPSSGSSYQTWIDDVSEKAAAVESLRGGHRFRVPVDNGEEVLKLCDEALALLGDQPNLPDTPTDKDRLNLKTYCDYAYYFAAIAFQVFYYAEKYEAGIPYGQRALDAALTSYEHHLNSDSIIVSNVMQGGKLLGHCYTYMDKLEESVSTYEKVIAFAQHEQRMVNEPGYYWQLGSLYSSLLYDYQHSEKSASRKINYKGLGAASLKSLVAGISTYSHDPDYLIDEFDFALSGLNPLLETDPAAYGAILTDTITALKLVEDSAIKPLMAYLYGIDSWYQYEFGHVSEAIRAYETELAAVRSADGDTSHTIGIMSGLAQLYSMSADEAKVVSLIDEMRAKIAADEAVQRHWISDAYLRFAEQNLWFLRQLPEEIRAAVLPLVQKPDLDLSDYNQLGFYAGTIFILAGLEKDNAPTYLPLMQGAIDAAKKNGYDVEAEQFQIWYELIEVASTGEYWFDEPRVDSMLPSPPDELPNVELTDLFLMHEHAYIRGDWDTVERITVELIRRGISEKYLDSYFWIYDY